MLRSGTANEGTLPRQNVRVGDHEVRAWLGTLLTEEAGFTQAEADSVVAGVFADPKWSRSRAEVVATVAYATARLPGGQSWWISEGQAAKERLMDGDRCVEVEGWIAEVVSPATDTWDPNWPEDKTFHEVELPKGSKVGETFVGGNGLGTHGRFRVEHRGDELGAVLVDSWYVLADEDQRSRIEADRAFAS